MATITFDTHEFVKRLRESGLSEAQAEVITDLQRQASAAAVDQARQDYHLDDIATKRDLKETEAALKRDVKELEYKIEVLRAETKQSLAETKAELIRWVVGVGILQIAIITALLLKLANQI
jgi:DNA-binding transcriptional MerR regulator